MVKNRLKYGPGFVHLAWIGLLVLLAGCGGKAEEKQMYRIGILSGLDYFADSQTGFINKMAELGYVEGENVTYDLQKTNIDPVAEQRILQQFVDDEVDLIFTFPTEASLQAKRITQGTGIPVVFANANIEGVGLVESVREPGVGITGVRYPGPDLAIKRLEILLEFMPEVKRIWLPYQDGYPIILKQLEALRPLVASRGVVLVETPAANVADLQADLDARAAQEDIGIDAILQIIDPLAVNPEAFVVFGTFAAAHHIPVGGTTMTVGGLRSIFGVSTKSLAVGAQAAIIADKILNGAPAGSIPVISADTFLEINYRAAQEMGIPVPEGLLSKADVIIR